MLHTVSRIIPARRYTFAFSLPHLAPRSKSDHSSMLAHPNVFLLSATFLIIRNSQTNGKNRTAKTLPEPKSACTANGHPMHLSGSRHRSALGQIQTIHLICRRLTVTRPLAFLLLLQLFVNLPLARKMTFTICFARVAHGWLGNVQRSFCLLCQLFYLIVGHGVNARAFAVVQRHTVLRYSLILRQR